MCNFNGYYDYKDGAVLDTIRKQKEDLGYKDETFIEEGKGVVASESIYQSVGFAGFTLGADYDVNNVVVYEGKLYSAKGNIKNVQEFVSKDWNEETPQTLRGSNKE